MARTRRFPIGPPRVAARDPNPKSVPSGPDAVGPAIAALAHELRNPLSAVRNAARLIADAADEATVHEAREIIGQETDRMVGILDAWVDAARRTAWAQPAPTPQARPGRAAPARSVLIVDDDRSSAKSMQLILARRGHDVRIVHLGDEVLGLALEFRPDAVLLDIGLPDVDGYEVARKLRASPSLDGTLIVAMTGYAHADDVREARRAGVDEHVAKPVDLDRLLALLRRGRP